VATILMILQKSN